ncbi:MAG: PilZ domain-containing protein [Candidatus Omnitrophota bacterium]|nr:PilZ domain-containing protein [Candidatus Omnitrophota bacterium]
MKIKIIILLGIFIFVQNIAAQAMESQEKLTRIAIASSEKIKYESKLLDNPPRLIIKFDTPNVFGKLLKNTYLNEGVIKNIKVSYYPDKLVNSERIKIKFISFWLNQKTQYKVWSKDNRIFIDFNNPSLNSESKQIEISSIVNTIDFNSKDKAAEALLASVNKTYYNYYNSVSKTAKSQRSPVSDLTWLLAFGFISAYILWFRPKEWKALIDKLINPVFLSSSHHEKRKWWRHNLLPLKDENIYIRLESPESNTKLGLVPRDIGYGGMSFECNALKRLKGKLNLSIFMPGAISPVEVQGNVAWQRNTWNLFRRRVGISFVNPPEKNWAGIHRYVEEQYAALKQ